MAVGIGASLNDTPQEIGCHLAASPVEATRDLPGLHAGFDEDRWVQMNLTPVPGALAGLYNAIGHFLSRLVNDICVDWFFMHKPPGLRLRLRGEADDWRLVLAVRRATAEWRMAGLITEARRDIYEPEATLFGGPDSMRHVHRLFTIDSRLWLALHADGGLPPFRALFVAMVLLPPVYQGLGITDWEDLDVWEKVRERTGRAFRFGTDIDMPGLQGSMAMLAAYWQDPQAILATFDEAERQIAERSARELRAAAQDWARDYFDAGAPRIGRRAAAALYTIFFLNRAGLSMEHQILLAEALSRRSIIE